MPIIPAMTEPIHRVIANISTPSIDPPPEAPNETAAYVNVNTTAPTTQRNHAYRNLLKKVL